MFSFSAYVAGLGMVAIAAVAAWGVSFYKRDVSLVDSLWSLMFIVLAFTYAVGAGELSELRLTRTLLMLVLVTVWALRLSIYITWRNWGHGEDRRYQAIRARNQPYFDFKSLYLIFLFQALMAWVISLPLYGIAANHSPLGWIDGVGVLLWAVGISFEAGGDYQLARFKADSRNQGKVMDRGFWKYTRHPNYFGDFAVWWGIYLLAVGAGAWWSVIGPALMSLLLMRVSGVTLLEKDIGERRPEYADYVRRTNAFFPGPSRPR